MTLSNGGECSAAAALSEVSPSRNLPRASDADRLTYTPFERIKICRPVNRIAQILEVCRTKNILDIGALDETAFAQKTDRGAWLHQEIAKVANRVIGIDSSPAVPDGGLVTANNAKIVQGSCSDLEKFLGEIDFEPDVIVAGEFIEHLEAPLAFLQSLRAIPRLSGCTLVLSTPNATAIHNCLIAFGNRESTHKDHLCIFSYKTLNTLLRRAGFSSWNIMPYHAEFTEMALRNHGIRKAVVISGEAAITIIERCFPLVSFGFLAFATI